MEETCHDADNGDFSIDGAEAGLQRPGQDNEAADGGGQADGAAKFRRRAPPATDAPRPSDDYMSVSWDLAFAPPGACKTAGRHLASHTPRGDDGSRRRQHHHQQQQRRRDHDASRSHDATRRIPTRTTTVTATAQTPMTTTAEDNDSDTQQRPQKGHIRKDDEA